MNLKRLYPDDVIYHRCVHVPMMSFIIDVLSLEDANWRASGAVTLWVSCTPRTIGPIVWRPHCRFQMPIFLNLGAQRIPREAWDLN